MDARMPYNKVLAGTLGAAVANLVIYLIEMLAKLDIPGAQETSIELIFVFALGYLVPERPSVGGKLLNRAKRSH